MYRSGNDSCHADLLSGFDLNITQGQRDIATVPRRLEGPPGPPRSAA